MGKHSETPFVAQGSTWVEASDDKGVVRAQAPRWRMDWVALLIAIAALIGLSVFLYPRAAMWVSALNESQLVRDHEAATDLNTAAQNELLLDQAREYNAQIATGAILEAGANVPTAADSDEADAAGSTIYQNLLRVDDSEVMARLVVPAASVDLPVFHGTADATLRRGVGHLRGTALPVGGDGTRSVLTAHRGLAESKLFNKLDRVQPGDEFYIQVAGEWLTYRVIDTQVVSPDQTEQIIPLAGRDLVTLVTCTPIGLNTHRILVTGERVEDAPAPFAEVVQGPGFPWWLVVLGGGAVVLGVYVWISGRPKVG
ncbi:class C sortase [Actinomycetaceae bacterium MB13-C1-2]|nr:class C sortase [Actinomycetaceae bacterium MB13-C1-2]